MELPVLEILFYWKQHQTHIEHVVISSKSHVHWDLSIIFWNNLIPFQNTRQLIEEINMSDIYLYWKPFELEEGYVCW